MFELSSREVHVWCASLDLAPDSWARLYATLSRDERERSARMRFERDARRFVAAHGLLRDLLGRYLQIPPERIRYVCNAFGKPGLDPGFGGRLRFNLSHSAGLALIAVAADAEVGVDLEHIRDLPDAADIAQQFFTASEAAQLRALPAPLCAEAFIGCWTKKEACLKACGEGLSMPLNGFSVPLATDPAQRPAELEPVPGTTGPARRWSLHTLRPAPGYIGALAVEGGAQPSSRILYCAASCACTEGGTAS